MEPYSLWQKRAESAVKANCIGLDAGVRASLVDHIDDDIGDIPNGIFGDDGNEFTADTMDSYLATEVMLPRGDSFVRGKVVSQKRNADGNPIGVSSSNWWIGCESRRRLHRVR